MIELVALSEALSRAAAAAAPLDVETVALEEAAGRTLAAPVHAAGDLVPFARSAMDGYAVRAVEARPGAELAVAARVVAGDPPRAHRPGTATAIATGAVLPGGADAVVPWEDVTIRDGRIVVRAGAASGAHLFPAGDDARSGDLLAAAGTVLDAGTLALLAAAGAAMVAVRRRPRVAIVCTGDEIVAPHESPPPGRVRDSNGILVRALATAGGADVVAVERVGDDPAATAAALRRALGAADLVVTTGGASSGPRDAVKPALDALGARFAFRSCALRPAKPTALARCGGALVLVLPGNPGAAFVGWSLLGTAIVDALCGRTPPPMLAAVLAGTIRAKPERSYAVHVALEVDAAGRLVARVLGNQCSSLVANAARADALAVLPPGERTYADGDVVPVRLAGSAPLLHRVPIPTANRRERDERAEARERRRPAEPFRPA